MTSTISPDILIHPDYQMIKEHFTQALHNATEKKESSLPFITHFLQEKPIITEGLVQGIVIGGTNYILSTETISPNRKRTILTRKTGKLPTFTDKETFVSFFQEHIDPQVQAIGINFGFPLTPIVGAHGELDGKLVEGTKEHTFTGVTRQGIGELVRSIAQKDIPVTVANDTVCLTLAGDGTEDGSMIAGTGFNIGLKLKEGEKRCVVNLEAGNFNDFEPTEVLKAIDAQSDMQGTNLFEKVISGKYLATYFNLKAQQLGIDTPQLTTSQELSALSHSDDENDQTRLARALLERSACLVAAAVAGVYDFYGKEHITIIGEGSLLWFGWHYLENVEKQLAILGVPEKGVTMKHISDSSLTGAIGLLIQ